MTTMPPPICIDCEHFIDDKTWRCKAFPGGIPQEILVGVPYKDKPGYKRFEHTKPYPGDHGIQFRQRSRIVERYREGMIIHIPPEERDEVIKKIREEKKAILRKFGHDDVEPII